MDMPLCLVPMEFHNIKDSIEMPHSPAFAFLFFFFLSFLKKNMKKHLSPWGAESYVGNAGWHWGAQCSPRFSSICSHSDSGWLRWALSTLAYIPEDPSALPSYYPVVLSRFSIPGQTPERKGWETDRLFCPASKVLVPGHLASLPTPFKEGHHGRKVEICLPHGD